MTDETDLDLPQQEAAEAVMSLHDFCCRASDSRTSVTVLLGGFSRAEELAGRMIDTESNYKKRLDAFLTTPVKGKG